MGKEFEQPQLEKSTPAVTVDDNADSAVVIAKSPTTPVANDLTGIYSGQIDNFRLFIDGEYESNNEEKRSAAQVDFIRMVDDILDAPFEHMSACMDHFIKVIQENPSTFTYEKIFAPYWGMKVRPNMEITKPYVTFIEFIISLSANLQRKPAFLKGYDVVSFLAMWNQHQAENLHLYLYE